MDTPSTAGAVSINGIMYDIYTSGDVYGEEIDSPYWPYNIEDWEDDMGDQEDDMGNWEDDMGNWEDEMEDWEDEWTYD